MTRSAHQSRLRLGRVSLERQVYLVTACTNGRAPLLGRLGAARAVIRELRQAEQAGLATTLAFVVMPDHLHWLMALGQASLASLIKRIRGRSAHAINRCWQRRGTVWQPGFHDHAVREEECLVTTTRYLLMNPVRAGLVSHAAHWPHWFVNIDQWPLLGDSLDAGRE